MRFLMFDVRLCFLPLLFGAQRIAPPQCRIASQFSVAPGCATALRSRLARCLAHDPLADFGICLMRPQSTGQKESENWSSEATGAWLAGAVADADGVLTALAAVAGSVDGWPTGTCTAGGALDACWLTIRLERLSGGLCDPGHGRFLGPCLWTVPSLRCTWNVAWQTPLDLLASWDSGQ